MKNAKKKHKKNKASKNVIKNNIEDNILIEEIVNEDNKAELQEIIVEEVIKESELPAVVKPSIDNCLSLQFSINGTKRAFSFNKKQAIAICAAVCVFVCGTLVSFGSYVSAKNKLQNSNEQLSEVERNAKKLQQTKKALESENKSYSDNMENLEKKTLELEDKVKELEDVKTNLSEQLDNITTSDSSAIEMKQAVESCLAADDKAKSRETEVVNVSFTPVVVTSYDKVSYLEHRLEEIDSILKETEPKFTEVATDITNTLAAFSNTPEGTPVDGSYISSPFNPTGLGGRVHKGVDLATRSKILPIRATAAGTVVASEYHGGYGNYVKISHGNGFVTMYAHNSENLVAVGDFVKQGDVIAMTGSTGQSTGVHCHYEIMLNGVYQDPSDF